MHILTLIKSGNTLCRKIFLEKELQLRAKFVDKNQLQKTQESLTSSNVMQPPSLPTLYLSFTACNTP